MIGAGLLDLFPCVKVVSNYGAGVNHIDLHATERRHIPVGNTPDAVTDTCADTALGLMIATARHFVQGDAYARHPETKGFPANFLVGLDVHHQVLGIVGMGRIGSAIAKRARAFDMDVYYSNRNRLSDEDEKRHQATYLPLNDLLRNCDFVVMACPLSNSTHKMIGAPEFSQMQKHAIFINVARGALVDTQALTEALANGTIAGAGDVLCCAVLCSIVLCCCAVLCSIVLCCAVLCSIVLCCAVLYCAVLCSIVLCCAVVLSVLCCALLCLAVYIRTVTCAHSHCHVCTFALSRVHIRTVTCARTHCHVCTYVLSRVHIRTVTCARTFVCIRIRNNNAWDQHALTDEKYRFGCDRSGAVAARAPAVADEKCGDFAAHRRCVSADAGRYGQETAGQPRGGRQ